MGTLVVRPHFAFRKTIRIDYFHVTEAGGGPEAFSAALSAVQHTPHPQRSRQIRREPLAAYELHRRGNVHEGDIGRLRMTDTPFVGNPNGQLSEVPLTNEQGLVECSAFLFDMTTGILAMQAKREAVSSSRLVEYLDMFLGNDHEAFELEIVINRDTEQKMRRIQDFRSIDVKYKDVSSSTLRQPDASTGEFIRGGRTLDAETIEVKIGSGRQRDRLLNFQAVRNLINGARRNEAQRLVVSGRSGADELLTLDLIEDRILDYVELDARGRTVSYERRRALLRSAYEKHLPDFVEAG